MSDKGSETRDKIIQLFKKERREMFTKEIAKKLVMSSQTISKYLEILRAEGVITKFDDRKPYIYWRLKERL